MHDIRFSARATNLSLLAFVIAGTLSGLGCFLTGSPHGRWIFGLHSIVGFLLLGLLYWKRRIIARSVRRHGLGLWLVPSALLLTLLLGSLASGVLWSTTGLPPLAGESGLTLHAAVSAALALLLIPHARAGWPRLPARFAPDRRNLLSSTVLAAGGLAAWRGSELISALMALRGSRRRFTGSQESGSFGGNAYPANAWLLDDPRPLDPQVWRLRIVGLVAGPLTLARTDLAPAQQRTATLDCTGGWYTTHAWQGVGLATLLARAGLQSGARSVVARSVTGYWRRFPLSDAQTMLVATAIDGQALDHEHGAPARLVAPGRRGYDWVKWVAEVEVSSVPAWLNWPLPLR